MTRSGLAILCFTLLFGALCPDVSGQEEWDKKRLKELDGLAKRFWKARPRTCFDEWEPQAWNALLEEAKKYPAIPAGRMKDVLAVLWKPSKKLGPRHTKSGKAYIKTPYGDAWFYVKQGGRGKGLVIGLHGGGEDAGSADEPAGTWSAKKCMGMYPQGIRLVHDTWNTVHGERFILTMIEIAKAQYQIDPDRVYSMGFSMGGTGSWFMAGRHPDLLAGATPAAGVVMASPKSQLPRKEDITDIQHGLVPNVRNLAMWYYIGLADKNCMPGTYLYVKDVLDELRQDDPTGYKNVHFKTYDGLAHAFPPGEPKTGIKFLEQQKRDAFPETLVWEYASLPFPRSEPGDRTTRRRKRFFYWIRCLEPHDRQIIRATREGNVITLEVEGRRDDNGISILLNDEMIDPQKEVVVKMGDQEVFRGMTVGRLEVLLETLNAKIDRTMVFDRRIDL